MDNPVSLCLGIGGFVLAVITFFIGRQTAASNHGKEEGVLTTKLVYIENAVNRIETGLGTEIGRLDGRLTEISKQLYNSVETASAAKESAKMVHERLNEHLRREHSIQIVDYKEPVK